MRYVNGLTVVIAGLVLGCAHAQPAEEALLLTETWEVDNGSNCYVHMDLFASDGLLDKRLGDVEPGKSRRFVVSGLKLGYRLTPIFFVKKGDGCSLEERSLVKVTKIDPNAK